MHKHIEVRKDFLVDRYAIISASRGVRPKQYSQESNQKEIERCYFCPGNEEPELEIGRVEKHGQWVVRWIRNKYPGFDPGLSPGLKRSGLKEGGAGYGYHEVIVDSPKHHTPLFSLPQAHIETVFRVYQERYRVLEAKPGIKYVGLFKNYGPRSGASIVHDHSQMVAQGFVPSYVRAKLQGQRSFSRCAYCTMMAAELRSRRRVHSDRYWAAFTPYAPMFSHELLILPRRHVRAFQELSKAELSGLASLLKGLVGKLLKLSDSFNCLFINSPKSGNLHFHIELFPRTSTWAGYEFLTGNYLISTTPEDSAEYYRK